MRLDVWYDKLPEDKAKYYNKTRMSIELFARKLGIAPQVLLKDFWNAGYQYDPDTRILERRDVVTHAKRNRYIFRGF